MTDTIMVVETCPKCGYPLVNFTICTYPPIPSKRCMQCGWYWEGEPGEVKYVPFNPEDTDNVCCC